MSAKKNYIYNSAYTILNMILPLVTAPYLARVIGADGVGVYAYNFAIAQYFVLIAKLGLTNYGTREIARASNDKEALAKIFSNLFALQCIATTLVVLTYSAYAFCIAGQYRRLALIFMIWVIGSFLDIDWFWFGLEEFKRITVRNILIKLLTVAAIFVFVKDKGDVWLYAAIMALGYTVGYVAIWFGFRKKTQFSKPSRDEILKHLKPCLVMLIPVLALNIYRSMDKVMLGAMSTMAETGFYDNGEKLIYCMSGLISSLGTVMLPKISSLVQQGREDAVRRYIGLSLKFMVIMTGVMAFGLMSVSDSIVFVLFGAEFSKSSLILTLTAPKLLFMGWSNVIRTQYVIPHKKDDIYIKSILYGSVINLIINALLIPRFASVGAVIGTLAAEFFVPFYQYLRLRKELSYPFYLKKCGVYALMGLIMYAVLRLVRCFMEISFVTLTVQVLLGAVIYCTMAVIYIKRFDKELWEQFAGKLKRK